MSGSLVPVGADNLWVEDSGGSGVPVVLLHPGITDSTIWDRVMPLLDGRRLIRFDRRGFGQSPMATEPFVPRDDLVTVLDHLGVGRAHLVGNSMGGETSLALAVTDPDRVASLTLLCPGVGGYPWPDDDDPDLEAAYRSAMQARDVDALSALMEQVWLQSGSDEYLAGQVRRASELDFAQDELEQPNPEQWEHLDNISVPTTVVAGALDPADSLQASVDLAARIPGAELVTLQVDHLPQYRDANAVAEAVLRTVARA